METESYTRKTKILFPILYRSSIFFNHYYSSISDYKDDTHGLDILNLGEVIAKHASHKSIELIKCHATTADVFFFKAVGPECFQNIWINYIPTKQSATMVSMLNSWN